MTILLHVDLLFPKIKTKKLRRTLSEKLAEANVIKKVNPKKIVRFTEDGDLTMELVEGLTVECHHEGCFHFECEDFNEQKRSIFSKAFATLSEIYDIGKEAQEVSFVLFAFEDKVPRRRVMKIIGQGVKTDFETQMKELFKKDVKVAGLRLVSAPDVADIIDVSGISVRMGPLKMTLDRFKDEATLIDLIEENITRIEKVLEE